MNKIIKIIGLIIITILINKLSYAECLSDEKIREIIEGAPNTPITGISGDITLEDAYCSQKKYINILKSLNGKPIGYKVGFTGKSTQERFKIKTPATAILFEHMFIKNGSSIDKNFGHRTLIEPDLMMIVKDSGIMNATNAIEASKHISSIHPYIELPALQIAKGEPITGAVIVAINMVATKMVMGPGILMQSNPEFIESLASMQTVFQDEMGTIIQKSPGSTLMGNPMNVVLWLIEEFNRKGITLKAGDRLSLGSVGKLFPLKENNKTYTYTLKGISEIAPKVEITIN
jgi:2-keto-4-pentenoate hydratase